MKADRRLWLTRDGDAIVEEGDSRAASLLVAPGQVISASQVGRLGLRMDADGRVTQGAPEVKEQPKPEDKQQKKPADKAVKKPATKRRRKRRT